MNKIIEKNKEEEKKVKDGNEKKIEDTYRISISRGAEAALVAIVDRVNDGFLGGKVNKAEMANWAITKYSENMVEADVRDIRAENFDEIAVLESLLRKAKESGKVPQEFKSLLQKQIGIEDLGKRKSKKALTEYVINGYNSDEGN